MAEHDDLEEARHEVLAENTAQAVCKHLKKLVNGAVRYRKRWIWELLQNARDAAPPQGVQVFLEHDGTCLQFRHDGVPFTRKSIAHLIYHGSTKHDLSDPIGQFGTGFMTTHLISRQIHVQGLLNDGRQFSFDLNRDGETADELTSAMDKSWADFVKSLLPVTPADNGVTTQYVYPVTEEVGNVVGDGVADLERHAPFLLAFNPKIKSVQTATHGMSSTIWNERAEPLAERIDRVVIRRQVSGVDGDSRYLAVMSAAEVSVAVELRKSGDGWGVTASRQTPRLFVAFPLAGSEDFCLPVAINSLHFEPGEDRDSLELNGDSPTNRSNMSLMEKACDLIARLAIFAAKEKWVSSPILALIPEFKEREWLNSDWMKRTLCERIIEPIRDADVLMNADGILIAPKQAWIPVSSEGVTSEDIWAVAKQLRAAKSKLPTQADAVAWADNLLSWSKLQSKTAESFEESFGLTKLCELVQSSGTVAKIREALADFDPISWLNQLHRLLAKSGRMAAFDEFRILPDQNGDLKTRKELKHDEGIDGDLKTIAAAIGMDPRSKLLDTQIRLDEILRNLESKTTDDLLNEALLKLGELAKSEPCKDAFRRSSPSLFAWLLSHGRDARLDGFPVFTQAHHEDKEAVCFLKPRKAEDDDIPLGPTGTWPELARPYKFLFPSRYIISDDYLSATNPDGWARLAAQNYFRLSPVYRVREHIETFIPDAPLPEKEEKGKKVRHRSKEVVDVSAIAFLKRDGAGLDAVRSSKPKALAFLKFLIEFVLVDDSLAFEARDAACECGDTHRYFPASWLNPVWENRWVPLGDNKRSPATAESLALLVKEDEALANALTQGGGVKLLGALKISLADLLLRTVADEEKDRVAYIGSMSEIVKVSNHDPEKARQIVAELSQSPELVDEILKRRVRRERVKRNQAIGATVEALFKEVLEAKGLRVSRTGVGSDFEVENDVSHDGQEILLTVEGGTTSYLVEVKATTREAVKMTVTQAKTATEQQRRFVLCMVMLPEGEITKDAVAQSSRFVPDIGIRLEPIWDRYAGLEATKASATRPADGIELVVTDSQTRFAIDDTVWASGLTLDHAAEHFMGLG